MADNSKRVLVFITAYKPHIGGAEIALAEIVKRLPELFFDIITCRLSMGVEKIENGANFTIHRVGFGGKLSKFMFPILGCLAGMRLSRKNPYNSIHVYQASYGGGAAWLYKILKPKTKFILTLQEGKNLARQNSAINFFRRLIIKKADTITAISEYLGKYAAQINFHAFLEIIPNGVDAISFSSAVKDEKKLADLGIKTDERVIITVSRLVAKNGVADLISAAAILKEKLPLIKVLIVGGGPLRQKLIEKAEDLGLKNQVIFLGEINNRDLPGYLKLADVFVRPSLSEGLGNSFLEAMAAGIPVIGAPVGGIPDFLFDGKTGLFCQPNNPADLSEKILRTLSDRQLVETMTRNARELIMTKYDWNIIARRFQNFYERYL